VTINAAMTRPQPIDFADMLSEYCTKRLPAHLAATVVERFRIYLLTLLDQRQMPPSRLGGIDWQRIADVIGVDVATLRSLRAEIRPALDALARELNKMRQIREADTEAGPKEKALAARKKRPRRQRRNHSAPEKQNRLDRKLGPVIEFPVALSDTWDEPNTFHAALDLHIRRHGETSWMLHRAVVRAGELDWKTISNWQRGLKSPRSVVSFEVLERIEQRYRLPEGYFREKLPHPARAAVGHEIPEIGSAERRRLAWHLPYDFDRRSVEEQDRIVTWVRETVISGATDYRRYQSAAAKHRFAIRFPDWMHKASSEKPSGAEDDEERDGQRDADPDLSRTAFDAPRQLADEMADLIRFKTSTLAAFGYQRFGVWGEETASQKVEHLGLMFGALAASPGGPVKGLGVAKDALTFGLLVFPQVWEWYLQWRERKRGFYTVWEVDMLRVALALTRNETGWMRQSPYLAARCRPIAGLVTDAEIAAATSDWNAACDTFHKYASARAKEIQRVARVHRDPFEPILVVLEAESPVAEYRKITDEIVRLLPDERLYPMAAAESVRSFLLLRLGLHLGLRQKNLRQLLVCPRGRTPTTERVLADSKRGELRWSDRDNGWEVFIPAVAFKNAHSSFFGSRPFRLVLPDLVGLYGRIDNYIERHRPRLLGPATDPGTFFVKTAKATSADAAYDSNTFYEAWRLTIQRYGVHNPFTGRGAIAGLLPHGPHNVRDVLATHILKKTGSYEQASYAIQDTPDVVAKHYGRFLPQDKAALAARILNQVWLTD
jgi:hypothetical protein